MSKVQVDTIDTRSGTATMTIGSTNTTTVSIPKAITLGANGTTVTIPSGATITNSGTATGFSSTIETPYAARMFKDANQNISDSTQTELDFASGTLQFNKGSIATLSNGRITVPSGADGFWWLHANARVNNFRANRNIISLMKNGSGVTANIGDVYEKGYMGASGQYQNIGGAFLVNASAGDYFTARFWQNSGGTDTIWERSFMGWYLGSAT